MMIERKTLQTRDQWLTAGVGWTPVRFVTASVLPYAAGLTSEESVGNRLRQMYLSQHGGKAVAIRCALTLPYTSN